MNGHPSPTGRFVYRFTSVDEKNAGSNSKTGLKAMCLSGSSELGRTEGDEVAAFAIGFLGVTMGTDRATIA